MKNILSLALIIFLAGALATHHVQASQETDAATKAAHYLINQQSNSGAIGNEIFSGWAIQALVATGQSNRELVNYLERNVRNTNTFSATDLERTILAALAGKKNPRSFGDKDLVSLLLTTSQNGQIGDPSLTNDDIFGILALLASGVPATDPVVASSLTTLANSQRASGGFSWSTSGGNGDSNNTATAIQALQLAKSRGWTGNYNLDAAVNYLKSTQNTDGGFSYLPGQTSDAASTSWAINGIVATGQNPADWVKEGNTPYSYLLSLQANNGGIRWTTNETPDILTTAYAAIALAGKALPVAIVATEPSPSPSPSPTPSPSSLPTPEPSPSLIPTPTPSITPTPSPSPTPTPLVTPTPAPSPIASPTPLATPQPTPSPKPVSTPTPTNNPTPTVTPSHSPSPQPSPVVLQQLFTRPDETQESEDSTAEIEYNDSASFVERVGETISEAISSLRPGNQSATSSSSPSTLPTQSPSAVASPSPAEPSPTPSISSQPTTPLTQGDRSPFRFEYVLIGIGALFVLWGLVRIVRNRKSSTGN